MVSRILSGLGSFGATDGETGPARGLWDRSVLHTRSAAVLSALYAAFVVLFPWRLVQVVPFSDFATYVEEFSSPVSIREAYQISGLKQFYSLEVLWDEFVRGLTRLTGDVSVSLRMISFFILFVWAFFLFRRIHPVTALLFLFNPTAIDVAMSGLRNGWAWSLVILGMASKSRAARLTLFAIAVFMHSSTLVLLAIYYATRAAAKLWKGRRLAFSGAAVGVLVGLAVTIGTQLVFGWLGDRRLTEDYAVGGGSLLQASLWIIVLLLQFSSGNDYIKRNVFVIAILAWYETMNPFIPWSYRVWGAFLPVIAVSLLDLPTRKRQLAFYCYCGYFVLQWFYWTKLLTLVYSV
jgi:hypothetical protein